MSIEQTDKIDFISLRGEDLVVLTVSDHLDWDNVNTHLEVLQEKLNTYLAFCESGEIYESYPKAIGKKIVFEIKMSHPYPEKALKFTEKARLAIQEAGFDLFLDLLL